MDSPWSNLASKASTLLLMLAAFAGVTGLVPRIGNFGLPIAAILVLAAMSIWVLRNREFLRARYLVFSLRTLLIFVVSLQIPVAMLFNPWNVELLPFSGGVLLAVWFLVLIVYSFDLAAGRYARAKTMEALNIDGVKRFEKK